MKARVLTGTEASILGFIARFPTSEHNKPLSESLDGYAKEVSLCLMGNRQADDDTLDVVVWLKNWAKTANDRE